MASHSRHPPAAPVLSVIVPCFNEVESVPIFHARLAEVLSAIGRPCEIIYVDDGSSDATYATILGLCGSAHSVKAIRLSRNFGKESAMLAGLELALGQASVIIDADLQDPPELIAEMHRKWSVDGVDVVYAVRRSRKQDGLFKRGAASLFYRLFDKLSECDVPHNAGDFRLLSRRAVQAVLSLPERTRFSKGIFAWVGFRTEPVYFDRPARLAGQTKWNFPGLLGLSLQAVTSFSILPLRLAGFVGMAAALASGVYGARLVIGTLLYGTDQPGYPSLMTALIFFAGLQLVFMGILGEYVGRIFIESKQRPHYLIDRIETVAAKKIETVQRRNAPAKPYERAAS
ncbi:MAG: glycosyltransferase family 2 protein [Rhizobiales bacterium]|nr:glycosyltransferase family 2 protein [Hyphomicrobiales bacterium]MBI3673770.1 glycosyltransferase family 2 protein [Hyphomicrobiales bacterium]